MRSSILLFAITFYVTLQYIMNYWIIALVVVVVVVVVVVESSSSCSQ